MLKRYIKRYVRMPCKQVSISIGAPLGNLEGFHLLGLREKDSMYADPEDIKISSLGAIRNFDKETGLS